MGLKTGSVTLEDYIDYTGEDLSYMLGGDDNANRFLERTEVRLDCWIQSLFHYSIIRTFPTMTDHQKQCYKYALLEQLLYVFKNGDISVDSGYDQSNGGIASPNDIRRRLIAPNAKEFLKNGGFWRPFNMGYGTTPWSVFIGN